MKNPEKINNIEDLPFQEALIKRFEQIMPEIEIRTVDEQGNLEVDLENREATIKQSELFEVLQSFGIATEEIEEIKNGLYRIKVRDHFSNEKLPKGYGYKGGAARCLLLRALEIDKFSVPRDMDLVRLSETEPEQGMDKELSERYMADDFETGYGVEVLNNMDEYFATRDFTVNEVLVTEEEIIATKQCLLDTAKRIIRITSFEIGEFEQVGQKMLAKTLRLYAEAIVKYGQAKDNLTQMEYEQVFINPFWLAVNLDRAFQTGKEVAKQYVDILRETDRLPKEIKTVKEAVIYLANILKDESDFYFRYAPAKQFKTEREWVEVREYENLPHQMGMSKSAALRNKNKYGNRKK